MRTNSSRIFATLLVVGATACDRSGNEFVPVAPDGIEPVIEVGAVQVLSADDVENISADWCAEEDEDGARRCIYDQVGPPEPGYRGGVTFTFKSDYKYTLVVVDPEAVFWNQSVSVLSRNDAYAYPDNYLDDGDLDLFGGLSSYYTGSPGVELGDFKGYYTDGLGETVEIAYSECNQVGYRDQDDAHAGRGTPEFCVVPTDDFRNVEFTIVLDTFSVPLDDDVVSFGAFAVGYDAPRDKPSVTECTIPGESLDWASGAVKAGFLELETAFCAGEMAAYCCENPEMCGDDPPSDLCAAVLAEEE